MGRVKKQRIVQVKNLQQSSPVQTTEERLKVFANIIVDRLIEEQQNKKLTPIEQRI
jgi:hypothetical protein